VSKRIEDVTTVVSGSTVGVIQTGGCGNVATVKMNVSRPAPVLVTTTKAMPTETKPEPPKDCSGYGVTPCGRAPNMTVGPYLRVPSQVIPIPGVKP